MESTTKKLATMSHISLCSFLLLSFYTSRCIVTVASMPPIKDKLLSTQILEVRRATQCKYPPEGTMFDETSSSTTQKHQPQQSLDLCNITATATADANKTDHFYMDSCKWILETTKSLCKVGRYAKKPGTNLTFTSVNVTGIKDQVCEMIDHAGRDGVPQTGVAATVFGGSCVYVCQGVEAKKLLCTVMLLGYLASRNSTPEHKAQVHLGTAVATQPRILPNNTNNSSTPTNGSKTLEGTRKPLYEPNTNEPNTNELSNGDYPIDAGTNLDTKVVDGPETDKESTSVEDLPQNTRIVAPNSKKENISANPRTEAGTKPKENSDLDKNNEKTILHPGQLQKSATAIPVSKTTKPAVVEKSEGKNTSAGNESNAQEPAPHPDKIGGGVANNNTQAKGSKEGKSSSVPTADAIADTTTGVAKLPASTAGADDDKTEDAKTKSPLPDAKAVDGKAAGPTGEVKKQDEATGVKDKGEPQPDFKDIIETTIPIEDSVETETENGDAKDLGTDEDDTEGNQGPPPAQEKPVVSNEPDEGSYNSRKIVYTDSHFFTYFLTVVVLCIVVYLVFHNKQKIIALIVEGRQNQRKRPNTTNYKRLDSSLEEAMQSNIKATTTSHIIF